LSRLTEGLDYLNSKNPDYYLYNSISITDSLKAARKDYRNKLKREAKETVKISPK